MTMQAIKVHNRSYPPQMTWTKTHKTSIVSLLIIAMYSLTLFIFLFFYSFDSFQLLKTKLKSVERMSSTISATCSFSMMLSPTNVRDVGVLNDFQTEKTYCLNLHFFYFKFPKGKTIITKIQENKKRRNI